MKIILLSGGPDSGKTTALNCLYDKLEEDSSFKILEGKKLDYFFGEKDFKCVIEYKGKKVAIYTDGDFFYECVKAIIQYANADVLVLAYRDVFQHSLKATLIYSINQCCPRLCVSLRLKTCPKCS